MCSVTEDMFCWPSSRPIVVESALNAPPLLLIVPPVSDGLNGRLAPGHGRAVRDPR